MARIHYGSRPRMSRRAPNGEGRCWTRVDKSIVSEPKNADEILEVERFEGATKRVASKLYDEAVLSGDTSNFNQRLVRIARGEFDEKDESES
jgi:hypothetical protein